MSTLSTSSQTSNGMTNRSTGIVDWLRRAESWLDARGTAAWIAAMVLAFIFVWPIGLALLAYMIWSKNMFCVSRTRSRGHCRSRRSYSYSTQSTGNTAFDTYRADTLRRLEEERRNFEAFLHRLREARDKAEFDQFMDERARAAREDESDQDDDDTPTKQ